MTSAFSTFGPTSQTFISQRLKLHYLDWGKYDADGNAKPPLILVHGGRDHARSWDWTAQVLREDFHVVAMDHRGHGDSDWVSDGNYHANDMVYDLAQLIHQLDEGPVRIVSHSMGGNVALRYTGMFPASVTKLVAIEGLGPSPEWRKEQRATPYPQRAAEWIAKKRKASGRTPRKYESIEAAFARMIEENSYLTSSSKRLGRRSLRPRSCSMARIAGPAIRRKMAGSRISKPPRSSNLRKRAIGSTMINSTAGSRP